MKQKLKYNELSRLDTYVSWNLIPPLRFLKFLTNKSISQLVSESLQTYLPAAYEAVHDSIVNNHNDPNSAFRKEVEEWLKRFDRL